MSWRYVRTDPALHHMTITVAARRVGYCCGFNEADGKVCVLVVEPRRIGKPPKALRHKNAPVQAYVRVPFFVGQHAPDIVVPGWAYFTLRGWVDEQSRPIEAPYEVCEA